MWMDWTLRFWGPPAQVSNVLLITITARIPSRALTIIVSDAHSIQNVLILLKNLLCARHHSRYLKFIRRKIGKHFCTQGVFFTVHKGFCPLTLFKIFKKLYDCWDLNLLLLQIKKFAVSLLVSLSTSPHPKVKFLASLAYHVFIGLSLLTFMPTYWFHFHCWQLGVSGRIKDPEWT